MKISFKKKGKLNKRKGLCASAAFGGQPVAKKVQLGKLCGDTPEKVELGKLDTPQNEVEDEDDPLDLFMRGVTKDIEREKTQPKKVTVSVEEKQKLACDQDKDVFDERAELKEKANKLFKANKFALALDTYSKGLLLEPNSHILYSNRSACHAKLKDWEEALADGRKAVTLQPDWPRGHSRVSCALRGLKKLKPAADSKKQEGNIYFKEGDYKTAAGIFGAGIELDPKNPVLYSNRSAAFTKLGDYDRALQDGLKTMELKPEWEKGYSRTAMAHFFLGCYEEAEKVTATGLKLFPKDLALKDLLTRCKKKL